VSDANADVLRHLVRAAEEIALAFAAALASFAERSEAQSVLRSALRAEERRWRMRGAADPAAARVADVFAAFADVLEPPRSGGAAKFDPSGGRWDTPARWRS